MPIRTQHAHPLMRALPAALRAQMAILGDHQADVSEKTGVPQPQVSRALNGGRKRLTPAMRELCRYAELKDDASPPAEGAALEATVLLQHLIGDSAPAASHMKAVLRSLAPLMADYRRQSHG